MQFESLAIPDVILIKPKIYKDERGYFMETRQEKKFAEAGIYFNFVQDNFSHSKQGILRGLHYQVEKPQGKLVKAVAGRIFDVAVDLRVDSPTFGRWVGIILSASNHYQLWVPPGFAHGFYVLSKTAEVIYSCTDFYSPAHERSIIWNDADLNIQWPLLPNNIPNLSPKDSAGTSFKEAEYF